MSRMVSSSLSVADLPLMEVGGADSFLRLAVAITIILPRGAQLTQVTDVLLLLSLDSSRPIPHPTDFAPLPAYFTPLSGFHEPCSLRT